jgi:glycosyltransferase involved in cell wall biosynthesis
MRETYMPQVARVSRRRGCGVAGMVDLPYTSAVPRLAIVEYLMSAGGVERVLRGLAGALLELPEARRWDITLLLSRYNSAGLRSSWPDELTGPGLHVEWLGDDTLGARVLDPLVRSRGLWGLPGTRTAGAMAARLARRLGPASWRAWMGEPSAVIRRQSERFDVLYFTYPVAMHPPDVRVPIVATPQDFNFKHFFEEADPWRRTQEAVTRDWLARSTRLLLTTQAVEQELRRYYPEYAAKAQVVPLGVAVGEAAPAAELVDQVRRKYRLPPRFVLMAGWVVAHKNQQALVEAAIALRRRGCSIPLVFVGPNAAALVPTAGAGGSAGYAGQVTRLLTEAGLVPDHDYFALGYVSDAEIRCLYRLATVFAVPSLYEGFGLPSLEAMQAGCPTVMAAIPPLEEQNQRLGGLVRTFDPRDATGLADQIAWVLQHPEEAAATARTLAERVPSVYDWKRTARAYLAAFEEAVAQGRRH